LRIARCVFQRRDVDFALRVLKKKLQREGIGILKEWKLRRQYEKPSGEEDQRAEGSDPPRPQNEPARSISGREALHPERQGGQPTLLQPYALKMDDQFS
jgi:ribosomal protein S21